MLIAQVSDIHASPENDHLQRFDRVLTWLTYLRPDILVLSGDLTDGPWREGYIKIAARLKQQSYPSLVLPGNSDDRHLMRSLWGEDKWSPDTSTGALHFTHDFRTLRLIGLDTTVDKEDYGSVAEHIEWLDKQLRNAKSSPVLLFMHHHVFETGIPTLDKSMCRGLGQLEALIKCTSARLLAISAGHVHRPVAGTFARIPAYICGSVCPANPLWFGTKNIPPVGDSPALMIHRYASSNLTSHHVCV
ncbi:metallophosphoesterase [Pantoea piersonii]|uniref:metallophosphoesterase n=1 Tax=Pantoea piersonii TaxID=2364647 RepID=UPI00289E9258|nr:metallophosphoesterase [Pantoea piersonii]